MIRQVLLGILAALFFSSTFILNRAMSLAGGDWVWSASLRFGYMLIFLCIILLATGGPVILLKVWKVFRAYWVFWVISGGIGFGIFYSLISFSSQYAPGWIIATTWQITILATPIILLLFGRKVPLRGLLFTCLIFVGILLVNIEHANLSSPLTVVYSALPVVVAAFAYPIGNQLVWEARLGKNKHLPHISDPILENGFARVLLLTMGSVPFWLVLLLFNHPLPPSNGQLISTALVALFSGVIATTIFLQARNLCTHPYEIAAVDATQSMEVIFSLLGEMVFLHGSLPGSLGLVGVGLTILGLVAYMTSQTTQ